MDKVSVVTVTYNCGNRFTKTAESIIRQSYENIEYIVIDGGSNDSTKKEIEKFRDHIDYYVSEPDNGIYDAMNKALNVATGDWIIFMNAGDTFHKDDTIEKCFNSNLEGYSAIYGSWFNQREDKLLYIPCDTPFWESKKRFKGMGFSHQSVFVRLEWAKRFPFDLSFKCCADYNMIYNIYNAGGRFFCANIPIAIFDGTDGFTEKNRKIQIKETAKILGIDKTFYFKSYYMVTVLKMLIKKIINRKNI